MTRRQIRKILFLAVCSLFLTVRPVHAYIDPSVMTYAIQAIAGIIIALGAFFGIYWRRVRKKLDKRFHLEEKRYTETETDELIFADPAEQGKPVGPRAFAGNGKGVPEKTGKQTEISGGAEKKVSTFAGRFLPGLVLTLAVAFLLTVYAPLELYMNNSDDFWFDFYTMIPELIKLFLILAAAGTVIFLLAARISRKACLVLLILGMAGFIGLYIQGNFLAGNLPGLDGSAIDWSLYRKDSIVSCIMWAAVFAGVCAAAVFLKERRFRRLVIACSLIITAMLAVSLVSVTVKADGLRHKRKHIVTTDGEMELSTEDNLIILMLDAVDARTWHEEWEKDPELAHTFDDFTFFENTMSGYPYTQYSIPFILSGQWLENEKGFWEMATEAYDASPLFQTLREENYKIGLYECEFYYDGKKDGFFENVSSAKSGFSSPKIFAMLEARLVGLKYAPFPLKKYTTVNTDLFATLQVSAGHELFNDFNETLMQQLEDPGFSQTEGKCFRFIHVRGAHTPYYYTKDVERLPEATGTYVESVQCCLTMARRYLEALRETDFYDNSAVIIMADHGVNTDPDAENRSLERQNPMLMIKGRNEHHDFRINEAPISHEDLQEAYRRLLDGSQSEEAFDWKEGDARTRRFLQYSFTGEVHLEEYEQTGMAWDQSTMLPTGRVYDLPKG